MAGRPSRGKIPEAAMSADGSRKQRNCLAQKAYRARQTLYIKELEKKLERQSIPETERYARLEESNRLYRDRLLDSYKKLESINISLQVVLESVGNVLEIRQNHNKQSGDLDRAEPSAESTSTHPKSGSSEDLDTREAPPLSALDTSSNWQNPSEDFENQIEADFSCMDVERQDARFDETHHHSGFPIVETNEVENLYDGGLSFQGDTIELAKPQTSDVVRKNLCNDPQYDDILSTQLLFDLSQMGATGYKSLVENSNVVFEESDFRVCATNSPFSDHIRTIEQLLSQKVQLSSSSVIRGSDTIQSIVSSMISAFICLAWEPMSTFLAYTRSHTSVTKITTSHVHWGPQDHNEVDAYYRPTVTQLCIPHPVVIDWVPFPSIRDRLILYHAANPRLDEIVCEIADAYACDIELSKLVHGHGNSTGYILVRDLLRTISGVTGTIDQTNEHFNAHDIRELNVSLQDDQDLAFWFSELDPVPSSGYGDAESVPTASSMLPARSINDIFRSRTLALQVFHLLGMSNGPGNLRLDPAFFQKHPELYDGRTDLLARGVPIRPLSSGNVSLAGPKPIDLRILSRYREIIMSTFEAVSAENKTGRVLGEGFVEIT